MGAGESKDDTQLTGETNLFPILFIGGVAAFIIGAMLLCCMTSKNTPQSCFDSAEELLRGEQEKEAKRFSEKLAKTLESEAVAEKKKKKNKKNKKTANVSESTLDKSLKSLGKHFRFLDTFERNVLIFYLL
jgi:hypothetical protein